MSYFVYVYKDVYEMIKFKVYGLVDPRNNKICYIGITRKLLKRRLYQHNNPSDNNLCKIAKLSRHLKGKQLKFNIVELESCKDEIGMYDKEIYYINLYKSLNYRLYNIQPGGKITINDAESYKRSSITKLKNKENYNYLKGEDSPHTELTDEIVINIFALIKKGYNNCDIQEYYNNKYNISIIKAIRSGQNFKHLFKKYLNLKIPSIKNSSDSSYTGYQKVEIIKLIENDNSIEEIHNIFNKISLSDLRRIKNKVIWKPVWKVFKIMSAISE